MLLQRCLQVGAEEEDSVLRADLARLVLLQVVAQFRDEARVRDDLGQDNITKLFEQTVFFFQ